MASVTLEGVSKVYGDTTVVDQVSLDIRDGEFMVLVGPSGCGKTTTLRMVAGLEDITSGTLRLGEQVVNHVDARARDIAMVFQNYALYPHMTVRQNIAFALRRRKLAAQEVERRVTDVARILGIGELLTRKPRQLSGGQRQRVAMGRAMVREPQVFLMDEPLSNLDAKLRVRMRAEVSRLQHELRTTTIYVTHDQVEAMTMGDRVAVFNNGVLQQVASPDTLYSDPINVFVASFIGSPEMNLLGGRLAPGAKGLVCRVGQDEVALPPALRNQALGNADVAIGIRPEHLHDAALAGEVPANQRLRGVVAVTELLGSELLVHVDVPGDAVPGSAGAEDTGLGGNAGTVRVVAKLTTDSRPRRGEPMELAFEVRHVHVFDLVTGQAMGREAG